MVATREDIEAWLDHGKKIDATHVLVVCDSFDYEDYPVYISRDQDAKTVVSEYNAKNMQRVMEVYSLSKDTEAQLNEHRSFNY